MSSSQKPSTASASPQTARQGMGHGPGGRGMSMPTEKPKDFRRSMKKLGEYLGPYRVGVLAVLVVAGASTVFTIVGPKILGRATTTLFEGIMASIAGTGGVDFQAIGRIVLTVLALYLVSAGAAALQGWIMAKISADITYRFRRDMAEKIHRMPLGYFDRTNHGEVLSRITNDVDTVNRTLSQSLGQMVTSLTTVVGVVIMMVTISWLMTLVALVMVPLSLTIVMAIVKRSQGYFREQQEGIGRLNGHVEEMYGGHLVMKAFSGEAKSLEVFSRHNRSLFESAWKSQFLSGLMMPIMMFVGNLGYVAVSILGGYLAGTGVITLGDIQAFIQYVRRFTQPISQMAQISNVLQQTAAAAERVFDFLEEDEQSTEQSNHPESQNVETLKEAVARKEMDTPVPQGHVEFHHVRFGYDPERAVITDFSAKASPGQKIALVGPTGAGKTTMVKLLMRFYEIQGGRILVDGRDIGGIPREQVRGMFGMVLQDSWLFMGSIRENIRYGRPEASDSEVESAAVTAHADHFIRTLPEGYDTVINEEANNISQGQKQLLTIARAILADPPMLILDEATSSVDTRTEILIQRAMDRLMAGRTSFIIAHRLSTIQNADLILVMKQGDIVEQGSHQELLDQGGHYADLYASQFEAEDVRGNPGGASGSSGAICRENPGGAPGR